MLLYFTWVYPCWWLAQALVSAGPELLRGTFEGAPLRLGVSAFGVTARLGGSMEQAGWTLAFAAVGFLGCLAVARRAPPLRAIAVFGAVWVAYGLAWRGVAPLLFRPGIQAGPLLLLMAGFAAFVCALGRLPLGAVAPNGLGRGAALSATILAPLAAMHALPAPVQAGFRPLGAPYLLAGVAAAIALACWKSAHARSAPARPAASAVALGVVASLAVFFGAQQLGRTLEARAEVERQASLAPAPDVAPLPPVDESFYFKGVNFTSEWPDAYGSKVAARVLAELPGFGVNSVALVPYASQRPEDAELSFPLRMERDELILATAKIAHAEGLRVLLKPQVWIRGGGLYPGSLRYDDPRDRARWFASYARFVEHYAKLATRIEADMFCVGVELAQLSPHEREWRELIALARAHYSGPVVYAANFGEEFESVRFWDALDYIGLDNYYPLPDDRSTDAVAARIEQVYRRYRKPVLFTEAGFATYERSHEKPWDDEPGGALSPEAQARNVEALFQGFHGRPWLRGIFWWKVGTSARGGPEDGSHILWGKPAMNVIGKWFVRPPAPPPMHE